MLRPAYYWMAFDEKEALLETDEGVIRTPAGELMIAFMDAEWEKWIEAANEIRKSSKRGAEQFGQFYSALKRGMEHLHPLTKIFVTNQIGNIFLELTQDPEVKACVEKEDWKKFEKKLGPKMFYLMGDVAARCSNYFSIYARETNRIKSFIKMVLDQEGCNAEWGIFQRYAWFRLSDESYQMYAPEAYAQLNTEVQIEVGTRLISVMKNMSSEEKEKIKNEITAGKRKKPVVRRYWATDKLEALLYLEFDHMAEKQIPLRTCAYCGRYFIPYSSASRYCGRPIGNRAAKTCKDIGAASLFQEKVNADEAKALYIKVDNRIQTYVNRQSNDMIKAKLPQWREWASGLLAKVEKGELGFDDFKREIDLPSDMALKHIVLGVEEVQRIRDRNRRRKEGMK